MGRDIVRGIRQGDGIILDIVGELRATRTIRVDNDEGNVNIVSSLIH